MGRKKEPDSWRSKGKGDCFTTKGGQVVCEGSKGMNYKPKGRSKSTKKGTRVQTRAANKGEKTTGKFKVVDTTTKESKKGKNIPMVKLEYLTGDKKGQVRSFTKNNYNKLFVRI